jgi:hypothetical protein
LALPGHPVTDFYCIDFTVSQGILDGDYGLIPGVANAGPNLGPHLNGVDVSSYGNLGPRNGSDFLSGGVVHNQSGYTLTADDAVRNVSNSYYGGGHQIDQLPGTQWFQVIGPIDNPASTYHIQCPVGHTVTSTCPTPGAAFTDFTRSGVSIAGETNDEILYRPSFDPGGGAGYADNNYTQYGGQAMNGLTVMGEKVAAGLANFNGAARNGPAYYSQQMPGEWWDPTIVVPGIH